MRLFRDQIVYPFCASRTYFRRQPPRSGPASGTGIGGCGARRRRYQAESGAARTGPLRRLSGATCLSREHAVSVSVRLCEERARQYRRRRIGDVARHRQRMVSSQHNSARASGCGRSTRGSSMAKKKQRAAQAKAMLETATDMHNSGVLDQATYDKITMRHLGSNVPKAMPVTAAQIRAIRDAQYKSGGIRPTSEPDGRLCVAAGTGDQATDRRCARAFEHYQAQRYGSHLVTELATKRFRG